MQARAPDIQYIHGSLPSRSHGRPVRLLRRDGGPRHMLFRPPRSQKGHKMLQAVPLDPQTTLLRLQAGPLGLQENYLRSCLALLRSKRARYGWKRTACNRSQLCYVASGPAPSVSNSAPSGRELLPILTGTLTMQAELLSTGAELLRTGAEFLAIEACTLPRATACHPRTARRWCAAHGRCRRRRRTR